MNKMKRRAAAFAVVAVLGIGLCWHFMPQSTTPESAKNTEEIVIDFTPKPAVGGQPKG